MTSKQAVHGRDDHAVTPREQDVVGLLALGLTAEEIAAELYIAPRTVRAYTDSLKRKMGVRRCSNIAAAYRLITGRDPLDEVLRKRPQAAAAVVRTDEGRLGTAA